MGKFIDLSGQKFGRLVVNNVCGRAGPEYLWSCTCECGNSVQVRGHDLRSGHTTSCGCAHIGARLNDLTGKRYGRLVVVERAENAKNSTMWRCVCDCGNEAIVAATSLYTGSTSSCGCLRSERVSSNRKIPMIGKRFGRLTVLEEIPERRNKLILYSCKCDCGNTCIVPGKYLRQGRTKSCGCASGRNTDVDHPRHGLSKHPLFHVWGSMLARCYNPNSQNYKYYGGRGISVCDEWRHDFVTFYEWATSNGYSKSLTIDRINVDGNYSPSNCRWVATKVQNMNRRNTVKPETIHGVTKSIKDWSEEYGISYGTVMSRIKRGWDVRRALETPPMH